MKYSTQVVETYYVSQGLPRPEFELEYIPNRKFRLDIAFVASKTGLEVQGGIFMRGRTGHTSIKGMKRDMEKHNLTLLNGWRVLHVLPQEVCMLDTVKMIKKLLGDTLRK